MFHFAGFKGCILRLEVENKKVTIKMMILTHDFEHDDSDVVINNDLMLHEGGGRPKWSGGLRLRNRFHRSTTFEEPWANRSVFGHLLGVK